MSRTSVWTVAAVLAMAALASEASAQAGDDSDLARSLARRGWFDLADELVERIDKGGSSPEAKSVLPLLRAELLMEKSSSEQDPDKIKTYMGEAVSAFEKFISANPTHAGAFDAKVSLGWLLTRKARTLAGSVDLEQNPEKTAGLKAEAHKSYEAAEKYFRDFIEALKAAKTTDAVSNALMDARMELPRTILEHAKAPGLLEDARKKILLKEALAILVDFEFDYGDRAIAFEATLEAGRVLTELEDFAQAEKKLKDAGSLRLRLAEAKIPPNDYHLQLIHSSYLALAQMYVRQGKFNIAKTFIDTVFKDDRTVAKGPKAADLKLEKAEAMFRMKDVAGANALAAEVQKADPNGRGGYLAREKNKKWAEGGGSSLGPDQLMVAADTQMDRDQFPQALATFRRCIEAAETPTDKAKYAASAWFKMGQCFQAMHRPYEAIVAYEMVFRQYPKSELAAKACFETLRVLGTEFAATADPKDEEQKDKLITYLTATWPNDKVVGNLKLLQAEKLEKLGKHREAADLYLQVGEDAEAYESALVSGAYNLRIDAVRKWEKGAKDPAVQKDVKETLSKAEAALKKFLVRLGKKELEPPTPDLQKARAGLAIIANQEIAYILMHEAVGRVEDALKFLEDLAKRLPPEDERLSRIWGSLIQAHLAGKNLEPAVKILDQMFERFPDAPAIARACKSVAINLDELTQGMITAKADPAAINENLKKISKYYSKWLNLAPALGMKITMLDVTSVSEALYMIAKRINGLDEKTSSFVDLKGKTVPEPQYFEDAAFVLTLLVDGKVGKLSDKDRVILMTRLARCYGFVAKDTAGWDKAKERYEGIVKAFKLVAANTTIDTSVLQTRPELLGVYLELGYVYFQLGRLGQKFQFDNASAVFSNVARIVQPNSEPWWLAKYMVLSTLFERGAEADIKMASVGLENLERNSPEFDGGKFGIKERCLELKAKLLKVTGGR